MNEKLDPTYETEPIQMSFKEVLTQIWLNPRKVFKYIAETDFDDYYSLLLILVGVSNMFGSATDKHWGDHLPLAGVIAVCVVGGALLGWISIYLFSALISWTGNWFNGEAPIDTIVKTIVYASIPTIFCLPLVFFQMGIFGNDLFCSAVDLSTDNVILNFLYYISLLLETVLGIWSFVIIVIGISEVQKLSVWKAILNVVLAALLILVPLGVLAFLF